MVELVDKGLYWISYKGRTIIGRYSNRLTTTDEAGFESEGHIYGLEDVKVISPATKEELHTFVEKRG